MEQTVWELFEPLWADIKEEDEFYSRKPLLAHYTSTAGLESILRSNELWFANPLLMNDHEEVRFGIEEGSRIVKASKEIASSLDSLSKHSAFLAAYEKCYFGFSRDHVLDTYVFSMSDHERSDNDGLLSMWRGYGGNGSGVAIVLDSGKIDLQGKAALILAKVHYGNSESRIEWLKEKIRLFASLLSTRSLPVDQMHVAAVALFERIKSFALFTKHSGFSEEREWRVVYMPSRDAGALLKACSGYSIGARGAAPRLRFPLSSTSLGGIDLSVENIVDRLILGPTASSRLAVVGIHRILDSVGHPELKKRVVASGIPYRDRP